MPRTLHALDSLLSRLLRTESILTIAALGLYVSGRIETIEEALVVVGSVAGFTISRGLAKQGQSRESSQ